MKKLLVVLLVINIIVLAYGFFMVLASSLLYGIIFLAIGILELIPIIAIIFCLDNIEDIQYENKYLREKVRKIEDQLNGENKDTEYETPVADNPNKAWAVWECVKCGTVNKTGTDKCSNCKAAYSPFINPTDDPTVKKRISRFIKFK